MEARLLSDYMPRGFEDLEVWRSWVLDTEVDRHAFCRSQDMETITAFYEAMLTRIEALLEHLNNFPLDALPRAEERLLKLAFSFIEASLCVEMLGQANMTFGMPIERFQPRHETIPTEIQYALRENNLSA